MNHQGIMMEKEIVDESDKIFKLNVYAYGSGFNGMGINFHYNGDKMSPINTQVTPYVNLKQGEGIIKSMVTPKVNGYDITDNDHGWLWIFDSRIDFDRSVICISATTGRQSDDAMQRQGVILEPVKYMPLDQNKSYLLYSIYFKANEITPLDQIYSFDFTMVPSLMDGVMDSNRTGTLLQLLETSQIAHTYEDVYMKDFPTDPTILIRGGASLSTLEPNIGDTLSVTMDKVEEGAVYRYNWRIGNKVISITTKTSIELNDPNLAGKRIAVDISAENCSGKIINETWIVIPAIPTLEAKTDTTIQLKGQPNCVYKHREGEWNNPDSPSQDSPVFENLNPDTLYSFNAMVPDGWDSYNNRYQQYSKDSKKFVVRTLRSKPINLAVVHATNQDATDGKIIGLDETQKYEYKVSGIGGEYIGVTAGATKIDSLGVNTYSVRLARNGEIEASMPTEVDVQESVYTQVRGIVNFKPLNTESKAIVTIYDNTDMTLESAIGLPVQVKNNEVFTLEIPQGTYKVVARANNHTRAMISNVIVSGGSMTIGQNLKLYSGECNGDNVVDIVDLTKLMIQYGKSSHDLDLNGDEVIDVIDITALMISYGKGGQTVSL